MTTNLQRIRQAAGLSQRQLADKAKINFRTLQDYEQGRKSINRAAAEEVQKIADALGCSVKNILEYME